MRERKTWARGEKGSHDDQVDEIDTRCFGQLLVGVILIDGRWQVAVFKPEIIERNAVALEVPVRHRKGAHSFYDTDEAVGLEYEFPINQAVDFGLAGPSEQDVGFRSFIC